jgi:hypothetical protein
MAGTSNAEVFAAVLESWGRELHFALPATVEKYDKAKQRVDVKLGVKRPMPNGRGGFSPEDMPVLPNLRVCFEVGGGFMVTVPIRKGDRGTVVFNDFSIAAYLKSGDPSDPGDVRAHHLGNAVFWPGGPLPDGEELSDADDAKMRIGKDGTGDAQIEITDTEGRLGQGASDGIVTKKDLGVLFNAISSAAVVAQDGGASLKAAIIAFLASAGWATAAPDGQCGSLKWKAKR